MQKPDALDRLFQRLADGVRRDHPGATERSVTISEIYQRLVPYRAVRAELGFSELAEYEHTLLRLLAGEKGYVQVEMPQVREELQRELRAANPILGMYRDYAAVGVRVKLGASAAAEPASRVDAPTPPFPAARAGQESRTIPDSPPSPAPSGAEPRLPQGGEDMPRTEGPASPCRNCGGALPVGRTVRFCPHCGESQKMAPCRACGTALEPEWKFCIRCGYPRRAPAAARA